MCVYTCVVNLDDGLESISRGWDSVGRRLAGAATHALSLPALDDEVEPLHPPISSATQSSTTPTSDQGPVQQPNSHCRWISRVFNRPSIFPQNSSTPPHFKLTPALLPPRIFAGFARIFSNVSLHGFFPYSS